MRLDFRSLRSVLFTVLLLSGQTATIAHELDHDLQASDNYCSDCLTQSVFGCAIISGDHNLPVAHTTEGTTLLPAGCYTKADRRTAPARTQRAPTIEELFSNGPYLATTTFEIGDSDLDEETSTNIDLYWHKTSGKMTFTANFFYNHIEDFIFLQKQDLNGDDIADRVEEDFSSDVSGILDPDEDEEPLLVFQTQDDAKFFGFELESVIHLLNDNRGALNVRVWTDPLCPGHKLIQ